MSIYDYLQSIAKNDDERGCQKCPIAKPNYADCNPDGCGYTEMDEYGSCSFDKECLEEQNQPKIGVFFMDIE